MRRTIGFIAAAALAATAPAAATPKAGRAAPDFIVTLADGSKRTLADYRGKVLVINYWATWCGPCKSEMPMMDAMHRRIKGKGFEIIGVVTRDSVPVGRLKELSSALSYPLASGLRGGGYGIIDNAVPTSYVIDRKGQVRYAKPGSFTPQEFIDLIVPIMNEAA